MLTLQQGLAMELKGIRLTRKAPTCYATIKREYGLKGSRQRVFDQFSELVREAEEGLKVTSDGECVELS
tara:strand:- start:166 stop:372 length:207 start_codon:yes stop_codon:yes gene_type:complete